MKTYSFRNKSIAHLISRTSPSLPHVCHLREQCCTQSLDDTYTTQYSYFPVLYRILTWVLHDFPNQSLCEDEASEPYNYVFIAQRNTYENRFIMDLFIYYHLSSVIWKAQPSITCQARNEHKEAQEKKKKKKKKKTGNVVLDLKHWTSVSLIHFPPSSLKSKESTFLFGPTRPSTQQHSPRLGCHSVTGHSTALRCKSGSLSIKAYFFWLCQWHAEVPGPETEPMLQL